MEALLRAAQIGLYDELTEPLDFDALTPRDRLVMADLYRCVITKAPGWKALLDHNTELLDVSIYMENTVNCSCGRYFEQHPTTIDEIEGQALEKVLKQIREGCCACISNRTNQNPAHARRPAKKTLLHAAAAAGYGTAEIVEYLLEKKCSVNRTTGLFSFTPLFRAVCSKSTTVIKVLLSCEDINVNIRSRQELYTPLLEAILGRYQPAVDLLLATPTIDLNVRNFRQETPLIAAARMGELDVLQQLFERGADPNSRDQRGMTALMFSVMYDMKDVAKVLLRNGADINIRSTLGETPLIMAISSESYEVTRILLDVGADVNEESDSGYPPLMVATYSNFTNIVKLLLHYGVNIHNSNEMGYQAVHIAAWNGFVAILTLLLNAGAQPDMPTLDQNTPLSLAAHGNHLSVVEILMNLGCSISNADKDLDTPLHYATFNRNLNCVQRLLERGADPRALNRLSVTPLWNAVYQSHLEIAKLLVKKNVPLNIASQGIEQHAQSNQVITVFDVPRTPLWVAAYRGSYDIALLLIVGGCDVTHESWIGLKLFPGKSQEMPDLIELLQHFYTHPRPLTWQVRSVLRQFGDKNVRKFVRHLNIPEKFKNFITLKEETE